MTVRKRVSHYVVKTAVVFGRTPGGNRDRFTPSIWKSGVDSPREMWVFFSTTKNVWGWRLGLTFWACHNSEYQTRSPSVQKGTWLQSTISLVSKWTCDYVLRNKLLKEDSSCLENTWWGWHNSKSNVLTRLSIDWIFCLLWATERFEFVNFHKKPQGSHSDFSLRQPATTLRQRVTAVSNERHKLRCKQIRLGFPKMASTPLWCVWVLG